MGQTSLSTVVEKREKALTWLWWAFWGKWILTTILGIFFLLALSPCIKELATPEIDLQALITMQAVISVLVFGLALAIFLFLLKGIQKGKLWPLYILGMYEVLCIFILGVETMGYSINPQHGTDVIDILTSHHCSGFPKLYIVFRFAMSIIIGFVCLGAYACFILFRHPLKETSDRTPL